MISPHRIAHTHAPLWITTALWAATLFLAGPGGDASAEVVRLQIESREEITGETFNPAVGAYEKITGLIHLEVDPGNPANALITDLRLAPRNARGRIEFTTEFELYRPVDLPRGNDRLLYFVNNRGNQLGAGFFSNGLDTNWLYSRGWSYLWCGWNCDVVESDRKLNIRVPVVTGGGETITGQVITIDGGLTIN